MKILHSISLLISLTFTFSLSLTAQELYFPEVDSDDWETVSPLSLGWCQNQIDDLIDLNAESNTKALIILKSGKIALEQYFGDHDVTKKWYWASAGKSLTACVIGVALDEGVIDINNKTAEYLGDWTVCDDANSNITVLHQLTMTTGLDYNGNVDCTDAECLDCLNEVGSEWYYHNAPYTLLQDVVADAVDNNYISYTKLAIADKIGMNGLWVPLGDNSVYFSTARSMARFGLMMLANGDWNGEEVIKDKDYLNSMITPSQDINEAYGYLWWLNGQETFRLPSTTITFNGSLIPQAPDDTYMAIGKNGQYVIVIPSQETVIIRMGDSPDDSLVPLIFLKELMDSFNKLSCTTSVDDVHDRLDLISLVNTVSENKLMLRGLHKSTQYAIQNYSGVTVQTGKVIGDYIDVSKLKSDIYFITFYNRKARITSRFYKG